jgi:hypothetical protein
MKESTLGNSRNDKEKIDKQTKNKWRALFLRRIRLQTLISIPKLSSLTKEPRIEVEESCSILDFDIQSTYFDLKGLGN